MMMVRLVVVVVVVEKVKDLEFDVVQAIAAVENGAHQHRRVVECE